LTNFGIQTNSTGRFYWSNNENHHLYLFSKLINYGTFTGTEDLTLKNNGSLQNHGQMVGIITLNLHENSTFVNYGEITSTSSISLYENSIATLSAVGYTKDQARF
jgi:hypothetical protein